jgi:hypothetical protein
VLLIRNMNGRLRRLPASFPVRSADGSVKAESTDPEPAGDRAPAGPSGDAGGGGARVG